MPISPPNCFDVETSNRRDQEEIGRQLQDDSNQGSAAKADLIAAACAEKNTLALVDLATTPRGLLDDTLRRDACMLSPRISVNLVTDGPRQGLYSWDYALEIKKSRLKAKAKT